ncbi:hypothetical protein [Ruegeria atlantica]|uniref:hypothetical protein n=1 Tax=Ruegeria atlantica TaxID=81569 RepID=UPI00147C9DDE|nr:hypothetical protein [Ruegeria atlantica]
MPYPLEQTELNIPDARKKMRLVTRLIALVKEIYTLYPGALKLLICLSSAVTVKFMYPDIYYSSGWSGNADVGIYLVLPLSICALICGSIKRKHQLGKIPLRKLSDLDLRRAAM